MIANASHLAYSMHFVVSRSSSGSHLQNTWERNRATRDADGIQLPDFSSFSGLEPCEPAAGRVHTSTRSFPRHSLPVQPHFLSLVQSFSVFWFLQASLWKPAVYVSVLPHVS